MDTRQHTPGPWNLHVFKDGIAELTEQSGAAICYAEPVKFRGKAERDANARLIASAPELLEALRQLESTIRIHGTTPARGIPLENARKAIAKAGFDLI